MAIEIERRFLVSGNPPAGDASFQIKQRYLNLDPYRQVRVRTVENFYCPHASARAYLTIKGIGSGYARPEYEYEIPFEDAEAMLKMADGVTIEKNRICVGRWEVDFFRGVNEGLRIAEIELSSEEEQFELPPWVGEEITGDRRYSNICLARNPYSLWKDNPSYWD